MNEFVLIIELQALEVKLAPITELRALEVEFDQDGLILEDRYTPLGSKDSDIPTDVESDVDSRTDSVGGEVQPDWRRLEGREEQRRVDVEPSHRHGHRPHVTHVVKPTDPNEILADTEQIESSQERPEWPARPAAQERQEEEKEAETTPPSQPR
ncbi:hypothetical protein NECAME_01637 [Necator americanus]|uniref:Uncharacterized protein n=1 Tax=Necator americanus TaxID=51031 RepID=W2TTI1_NECAM|nr:hypothetical protein NECAME_01637 [Necator americanus]ETN84411.1 hypothetical protein NECAME_01637 [Necator americanus]